ncbi:MAG: hypothetical protein ABI321_15255 [Polyangia bacterium]
MRGVVFGLIAYGSLLWESAWGWLFRDVRAFFAAPELGLLVVVYLGLCGRGSPIALTATALAVGYLRDLLVGSPRGVEALAFALCALAARLLHGRVFLDRWGQLAIVGALFATLHAFLLMLLAPGDSSMRMLVPLVLSALCFAPIVFVFLRRVDDRIAPEQRSLHLERDVGARWR